MSHPLSETDIADLTGVAAKALKFDFYIFRKAYGSYYAVWATVIFLFIFLPNIIYYPAIIPYVPYIFLIVYMAILAVAIWITGRVFRNAAQIIGFKSILHGKRNDSPGSEILKALSITLFIVVIIVISIYGIDNIFEFLIFFSFLVFIMLSHWKNMALTFEKIPVEGFISLGSYILTLVMSLISIFVLKSQLDFYLSWIPVIAGWYFSAFYAIRSSRQFLEESNA